jgi:hypothetical protein
LSRKILEKRARESVPIHLKEYFFELSELYSYPEQLLFIDETSKDGRDALSRYGWSRIVSIYIFSVEGCDTFKSAQLRKEGKGPNDIPSEAESPGYESRTAELAWAAFSCLE